VGLRRLGEPADLAAIVTAGIDQVWTVGLRLLLARNLPVHEQIRGVGQIKNGGIATFMAPSCRRDRTPPRLELTRSGRWDCDPSTSLSLRETSSSC